MPVVRTARRGPRGGAPGLRPGALVLAGLLLWGPAADAQPPPRPTLSPAAPVRALAAGGGHTCALLADGSVRCWGRNLDGELAQGDQGLPGPVAGVKDAVHVAAGHEHTCAVSRDGSVWCWGGNSRGQLGRPALERGGVFPAPARVAALADAIHVAAGEHHSCALRRGGAVVCWGGNEAGQLGDGTTDDTASPVAVRALPEAVALTAGRAHTCALGRAGGVRCWGADDMGQRGGGGTTAPRPVEVPRVAAARAVAAGLAHTCALLEGGTVRCWGANEAGQLGTGLTAIAGTTETVRDVAGAVAIGAGGRQSCAILADGSQRCWGADGPPRAEHVIFAMRTPVALQTPGIAGARAVAPGLAHNCILLQAGTVRCRGNNAEGQLGDGTFRHSRPPVEVRGLASARALASGGAHACVILGDGGVHCWGSNARGQLGRPVAETSPRPLAIAGVAGAVAVAAGAAHACAVLGDTTVRCWGRNADGQLGRGFMGPSSLRAEAVVGLSQVRALAAGAAFTCALLADGTVRCWGQNAQGQLGDGTTRSATVPLAVQGVAGALALGAGASQACAVVAGGRAVCWGHLAHEASAPATEAVGLVGVPTLTGASAVAVGQNFGCATRDDLTLVCWGANDRGQLATPEVTGAGHPVMVTGVAYPVAVAAGALHACALRRDGKVKCWGRSHLGQLGPSGVGESSPVPVGVDGLVGVAALSAGGAHSCALLADGGVRCWGANESAQLGQDASLRFSHRAVPVDVSR